MAAGQNELGLFVLCQRECRRFVPLQIVAAITTIEIRSGGKLSRMLVGVAVRTALELDLEQRIFPVGSVASRAEHCGMSALQGIGCGGVVLYRECRRLEAFNGVARGALATARTFGKLSLVWVWLVTIHAPLKDQRLLEISVRVAL